jgi:UDP-N-acetylmuramate--alanine ligase
MIRVGIFFGGPSREREISFAGGRTVFDNLNKSLFRPVLFFVDSALNLIELDWRHIYKGTIRDFYPPVDILPDSPNGFQIYIESLLQTPGFSIEKVARLVGELRQWSDLHTQIDIAFLALHGQFGEDGQIQGILESQDIPYTGSGLRASAIGMDKSFQKKLMHAGGFPGPVCSTISREDWLDKDPLILYQQACSLFGEKVVIRPANQGSSIGVSIIPLLDPEVFISAVDKAFFRWKLSAQAWQKWSLTERINQIKLISDIREGSGFPLMLNDVRIDHPEELLLTLNRGGADMWIIESVDRERSVLLEGFIEGKEFSCIVIRTEDGKAVALPPTQIIKGGEIFDYRSKYLPGLSRKETPIHLPEKDIQSIRKACERLFHYLDFQVYARIDGFFHADGSVYLNDPNTTSGMMPSSFFFHQAAEIGLNPSQFLTYIIRSSLQERLSQSLRLPTWAKLIPQLDHAILVEKTASGGRKKIAVLLGGYSSERHISIESGRNIYEKLASSDKYEPIPVFLTGQQGAHELFVLPVNLLLKDNADDIRERVTHNETHPVIEGIRQQCGALTEKYTYQSATLKPRKLTYEQLALEVDGVFIALHGRPGEDGEVQGYLEKIGLPYNGSDVSSSQVTIDKYRTLQTLRQHGFHVANQWVAHRTNWFVDKDEWLGSVEQQFQYPFIGKPVDDGCSSAVKIIQNRTELESFAAALYREQELVPEALQTILRLKPKEEFPRKEHILFETLIRKGDATHFLEITCGLVTHWEDGQLRYEVFEPSEALSGGDVLSLEEKFLAGEGQNITPARFSRDEQKAKRISAAVRKDLEQAARILGVTGYSRIDAFVKIFDNDRVETWIIEVNSLPGMTPATCIFHQAALNGYTPYHFIDQILEYSFHGRTTKQHV